MFKLLGVLPEERRKVAFLLLQYVWVVAVTIAGKSARDAFFLSRYNKVAWFNGFNNTKKLEPYLQKIDVSSLLQEALHK